MIKSKETVKKVRENCPESLLGDRCTHKFLTQELKDELRSTVKTLTAPGKGILAADESTGVLGKMLQNISIDNTEENRRKYRQLLFNSDVEIAEYISGIILFHDTLYQKSDKGTPLVDLIKERDILFGVKVDKGLVTLFGSEEESATQGLDDLQDTLIKYKQDGCQFAKWRVSFKISKVSPSYQCIKENSNCIAKFAAICQSRCMVPILHLDILQDGNHDLERAQLVTESVLASIVKALHDHQVYLEGTILVPPMTLPGESFENECTLEEIAAATVTVITRTVPVAIPGIFFCSGYQSEEEASINLNAINKIDIKRPWVFIFCFDSSLQTTALNTWAGNDENVELAQLEFVKRARANSLATCGKYERGTVETDAVLVAEFDD